MLNAKYKGNYVYILYIYYEYWNTERNLQFDTG